MCTGKHIPCKSQLNTEKNRYWKTIQMRPVNALYGRWLVVLIPDCAVIMRSCSRLLVRPPMMFKLQVMWLYNISVKYWQSEPYHSLD